MNNKWATDKAMERTEIVTIYTYHEIVIVKSKLSMITMNNGFYLQTWYWNAMMMVML